MKILYTSKLKSKKIVLLQGENGRKFVEINLKKKGWKPCIIECYKRIAKNLDGNVEAKKWRKYEVDALVATSSEILHQLKNIVSEVEQIKWLFGCKIFVVGNRLSKIAKRLGWKNIIISDYADNSCLLKVIKKNNC